MIKQYQIGALTVQAVNDIPWVWIGNFDDRTILGKSFKKFEDFKSKCNLKITYLSENNPKRSTSDLISEVWGKIPPANRLPYEIDNINIPDFDLFYEFFKTYLESPGDILKNIFIEYKWNSIILYDYRDRKITIFIAPSSASVKIELMLNPSLIAPFFTFHNEIIIHAAGILRHGKTIVFLAPDEGGKTTAARLSRFSNIICDDHLILRREKDTTRVEGTPWGLFTSRKNGPLAGFFFLEKADKFMLERVSNSEAFLSIWNEHAPYFMRSPRETRIKAFDIFHEIMRSVPSFRLRFPKDFIDWNSIDRAVGMV